MERQLTEGRPFGVLLRYALPVLGGNLFQLSIRSLTYGHRRQNARRGRARRRRLHRHHQLFCPLLRAGADRRLRYLPGPVLRRRG